MSDTSSNYWAPNWDEAPEGWNWLAQDEDGRWFWYAVQPRPGYAGGVWRSPRLKQQFAGQGQPNSQWQDTCTHRPSGQPSGHH